MLSRITCLIKGHKWGGRGWSSEDGVFVLFWECGTCGRREVTHETPESLQRRFDGYRDRYGDSFVDTDEFDPPKPLP
jgi:hypothetical protein